MEEISSTVKQNAEGASLAKQISNDLRGDAVEGSRVASDAVEAMRALRAHQELTVDIHATDGLEREVAGGQQG